MDIRQYRSWMYRRVSPGRRGCTNDFLSGVEIFISFACQEAHLANGKIRCPCFKCKNLNFLEPAEVKDHLHKKGFTPNYWYWTCHGEINPNWVSNSNASGPSKHKRLASETELSAEKVVSRRLLEEVEQPNLPPAEATATSPGISEVKPVSRRLLVEVEEPRVPPPTEATANSPGISDEVISQYFTSSLATPVVDSTSPISKHIEHLEHALSMGFPDDPTVAESLKASMLKVAKRTSDSSVPLSLKRACAMMRTRFPVIASKHQTYKEMKDRSSADLASLKDLITKRSTCQTQFEVVAKEQEESFREHTRMKTRLEALQAELAQIQAEINDLVPQITAMDAKVKSSSEARQKLQTQSTSLDSKIEDLRLQEDFLKQDLQIAEAGLEEVAAAWSELGEIFSQARRDVVRTSSRVMAAPSYPAEASSATEATSPLAEIEPVLQMVYSYSRQKSTR